MLIGVNADDAQGKDLTFLEHLLGMLDAMISDLGDVDQPFDVALQAGERAELGQARDHAFHKLTHAELFHALRLVLDTAALHFPNTLSQHRRVDSSKQESWLSPHWSSSRFISWLTFEPGETCR